MISIIARSLVSIATLGPDSETLQFFALNRENMRKLGWTEQEGVLISPPGVTEYHVIGHGRYDGERVGLSDIEVKLGYRLYSKRGGVPWPVGHVDHSEAFSASLQSSV